MGQSLPVATRGEVLADGTMIELVRDGATGELLLLTWDGTKVKVGPRAEHQGHLYVPADVDPTIMQALQLPAHAAPYGTTRKLFTAVSELLARYDLPDHSAKQLAYFIFATWFSDCLVVAPLLVIAGPATEVTLLFRILACLCRRSLLLGDVTPSALCSLPTHLHPTLLISQSELSAPALRLVRASNVRDTYILSGGRARDPFCAKAIYGGERSGYDCFGDSTIQIAIAPASRRLPPLGGQAWAEVARDFQAKFLMYRVTNHGKVRNSSFDVAGFTFPTAVLARSLGACIADDPELQSALKPFLQKQDEAVRVRRSTGLEAVVIEAVLVLCHEEKEFAYVLEITKLANGILSARGETLELKPRAVGAILDRLGLDDRPRNGGGHRILLLNETRRRVHELAHAYGVPSVGRGGVRCPHCAATAPTV